MVSQYNNTQRIGGKKLLIIYQLRNERPEKLNANAHT